MCGQGPQVNIGDAELKSSQSKGGVVLIVSLQSTL